MDNFVEPIKSTEDLNKVLNYLKQKENIKYWLIFKIGLYSGLRVSDILALNIDDVENSDYVEIVEKKTGKHKKFPLNKELQEDIKYYLFIRKKQWSIDEFEPLFIGKMHSRLDRSQVYRIICRACANCNINGNFGTHTMRKTFGYHHYQQFKDVALLQKIFNHSAPSITLRYIGIEQEEIDDSYKQFEYDYDKKRAEINKKSYENRKARFADIENSLEYLFQLYKKIDKKLDEILTAKTAVF